MRMQSRLLRLSLLASATVLLGAGTAAQAQDHGHMDAGDNQASTTMRQLRWSDPAAWPDGRVPAAGDAVTIARDMDVLLDVAPAALRSLTIQGRLRFADERDLELQTEWIYLPGGELQIGTEAAPFQHKATITLTDNVKDEDINTMGDRGIMLMRGTLNLHGTTDHTWTKLSATAEKGAASITVLDASGWRAGDEIVLASTDFDAYQAERRTITAVNGNTISFAQPLEHMHFGKITFGVDERGEVGNITRNIVIQSSEDSQEDGFGGHIMAMSGSRMYVDSVGLNRMGQNMHLARYPIHWHLIGEGAGQYIRNSAVYDTYSRCVTVHGTNNLQVENNVTFNNIGHCFFLEDAVETGNQFVQNLGILTKCHFDKPCLPTNAYNGGPAGQQADDILIPSDNTAATFWITSPDNVYRGNVAAGSEQIGFWIALPENGIGQFEGTEEGARVFPRQTEFREFRDNVAHSNFDGLMFDRGPSPQGNFNLGGNTHLARATPGDRNSGHVVSTIENFTGYKNHAAIWARGEDHVFRDLRLADNAIGYTHAFPGISPGGAAFTSHVVDSLFVGESDNIGNPDTPEEVAYGRSMTPHAPDFPIRGYEYYDFGHALTNVTFRNYQDNDTRKAGAISYLLYSNFPISTENSVEGLVFDNAKPVHYPEIEPRWAFELGSEIGYTGAVFVDKDGSLGGAPGSYVVIDNGIASNNADCEVQPTWNAAICEGDFGRITMSTSDGQPRAAGASPFAPPSGAAEITLSRNGRSFLTGKTSGFFGAGNANTTVEAGSEIRAETEALAMNINMTELEDGSWVIFELPGFATANRGAEQNSLAALRNASETSYFADSDGLWVKLVAASSGTAASNIGGGAAPGFGGGNAIQVRK